MTSVSKSIYDKVAERRREILEIDWRDYKMKTISGKEYIVERFLISPSPDNALNFLTSIKQWKKITEPMMQYLDFHVGDFHVGTRLQQPHVICKALQKASNFRFSPTFLREDGKKLLNEVGDLYRDELEEYGISLDGNLSLAVKTTLFLDPKVASAMNVLACSMFLYCIIDNWESRVIDMAPTAWLFLILPMAYLEFKSRSLWSLKWHS